MNANVTIIPPTEPRIELAVKGVKNFQATGDGFVMQMTVAELKELYTTITTALAPYIPITTDPVP